MSAQDQLRQIIYGMKKPSGGGGGSLVAHYKGENNTNDELGAHNGSGGGTTHYTASGHSGSAFSFDGSTRTDYIAVPPLGIGLEWSVECWIYPTDVSTGYRHIISRYWSNPIFGAWYLRGGGYLDYWINGASAVATSSGSIVVNTWTKIKLTRSSDNKHRIYINDILAATQAGTSTGYALNDDIGIGNNYRGDGFGDSDNLFKGYIDEVKFYNAVV